MSDPNFQAPQPGDPGTPRDVTREGDVVWDGNDPERYAGQTPEDEAQKQDENQDQPAKKTAAKKSTKSDSQQ